MKIFIIGIILLTLVGCETAEHRQKEKLTYYLLGQGANYAIPS
jgi:hypothetical protein